MGAKRVGTNFYLNNELYGTDSESDQACHVGRRSASGLYCWDCNITLCAEGPDRVHYSESKWHARCPQCGLDKVDESLSMSSAGRELGFNRLPPRRKSGVASASSFSWAFPVGELSERVAAVNATLLIDTPILDEYGDCFTLDEFLLILSECPLQSTAMVGEVFS